MDDQQKQLISFVVPVFNEEECVEKLYSRICETAESIGMKFELIYVDDHSIDSTLRIIRGLRERDSRVKIISFSRNFGHQVAVMAGLHHASGDCVITMDADLQDPPEIVPQMLEIWKQGFDVVYGIRRTRKGNWLKKTCYKIFYRVIHKISPLDLPLDAGDFCLMSRRIVLEMQKLNEERPFVRGLRTWVGFKQIGIDYDRQLREAGKSKYNIVKLSQLAIDGILSFSSLPLEAATFIGVIISCASILYALYTGITRILIQFDIISADHLIPGWATLVCSIMLLMGLQFIFLGILGKYVGRIFTQGKRRPLYIVQEKQGFEDD